MAELNTPLINELLEKVSQHQDFDTWLSKGKLPKQVVSQLCQPLKSEARFQGQPSRFYIWAIHVVDYIYKSWLALHKRLQRQLEGQTFWLSMLRSDTELVEETGCKLDTIRTHATQVLAQLTLSTTPATSCAFQGEKAQKV